MSSLLRPALMGVLGALAALVVNRGWSAYHDGLRPFVKEVSSGSMPRREAARMSWSISIGFVVAYALPFSLVTGIMGNLILFLGADLIGVAISSWVLTVAVGLVWGVASSLVISTGPWVFDHLPHPVGHELLLIAEPLPYLLPLMPVVAIGSQFGAGRAVRVALPLIVLFAAIARADTAIVGSTVTFVVGIVVLLWMATRERPAEIPDFPPRFAAGARELRRSLVPMLAIGVLLGGMGAMTWIAGDPGVTMLLGVGQPVQAGLLSILSWIAFLPLTTLTSLGSGAYTSAGNPDGILGVAYLIRWPLPAALAGGAIMAAEIVGLKHIERGMAHRPGLHSAGVAARDGMHAVLEMAFLLGGAYSANLMWPGFGAAIVALFWVINEATGTRVMRLGVGPIAAIVTGLLINLLVVLKISYGVPVT